MFRLFLFICCTRQCYGGLLHENCDRRKEQMIIIRGVGWGGGGGGGDVIW